MMRDNELKFNEIETVSSGDGIRERFQKMKNHLDMIKRSCPKCGKLYNPKFPHNC